MYVFRSIPLLLSGSTFLAVSFDSTTSTEDALYKKMAGGELFRRNECSVICFKLSLLFSFVAGRIASGLRSSAAQREAEHIFARPPVDLDGPTAPSAHRRKARGDVRVIINFGALRQNRRYRFLCVRLSFM